MGRIFETRKVKMFARWAKTAKAFTKLGKEIAISVKLGSADPDSNPRLRNAIQTARDLNMPKEKIEAAIKRAVSKDEAGLEELTYEAYAPHGVALMIETMTNNPTRTIANVRSIISDAGGSMATSGALDYIFKRQAVFTIESIPGDPDQFELDLIDAGLEDIFQSDEGYVLYASFENYGSMVKALDHKKAKIKGSSIQRIPQSHAEVSPAHAAEVEKLIASLEEDDDVQTVFSNIRG